MKNNLGVTLINMAIIILVIIIISSVSIIGGREILNNSKESSRTENLAAVKAVVNRISSQKGTAGVLTPAKTQLYGKPAYGIVSGDADSLNGWYVLDEDDLNQMGIEYVDEIYLANYDKNEVIPLRDYTYIENN